LLGVAELTKFVLVVFYLVWPLQWAFWRLFVPADGPRSIRKDMAQLALIFVLSLYTINLAYGFEGTFHRLDQSPIAATLENHQGRLGGWEAVISNVLGKLPVPLPRFYLQGIYEIQQYLHSNDSNQSYMLGRWTNGSHLFYIYGLLLKMPCGTWILLMSAAFLTILATWRGEKIRDDIFLSSSCLVILGLISLQAGATIHVRYAMPILPYAFIWIGRVVGSKRRGPIWNGVVLAAAAWSVLSSLSAYPHSLSYFNELAGGPMGGHAHLIDSNLDWGQDLYELQRWLDDHPEETLRGLAYFGCIDPMVLGIDYQWPPAANNGDIPNPAVTAEERAKSGYGVYAVSVNYLRGHTYPAPNGRGQWIDVPIGAFAYFRRLRPIATAGYSIYIYRANSQEIDELRRLAAP
jgi:hypothetical protein